MAAVLVYPYAWVAATHAQFGWLWCKLCAFGEHRPAITTKFRGWGQAPQCASFVGEFLDKTWGLGQWHCHRQQGWISKWTGNPWIQEHSIWQRFRDSGSRTLDCEAHGLRQFLLFPSSDSLPHVQCPNSGHCEALLTKGESQSSSSGFFSPLTDVFSCCQPTQPSVWLAKIGLWYWIIRIIPHYIVPAFHNLPPISTTKSQSPRQSSVRPGHSRPVRPHLERRPRRMEVGRWSSSAVEAIVMGSPKFRTISRNKTMNHRWTGPGFAAYLPYVVLSTRKAVDVLPTCDYLLLSAAWCMPSYDGVCFLGKIS